MKRPPDPYRGTSRATSGVGRQPTEAARRSAEVARLSAEQDRLVRILAAAQQQPAAMRRVVVAIGDLRSLGLPLELDRPLAELQAILDRAAWRLETLQHLRVVGARYARGR